ncbi:amino acid permease [Flavobacteriales bacterium]|jgi:basic amino acid/polyamine antiporter, APA family|nr:amino acid permease [Flavobacteriales bacterium]
MKKLNRTLTLPAIIAISIAGMLGGVFVIPGIATAYTGTSLWLAFLIAALSILPAVLSKSELATAMPKSGGAYVFIERALGPLMGTISGIGLWISLLLKSSFALVGLSAYLLVVVNIPSIDLKYVSILFLVLIMCLNIIGVKKVGKAQLIIVIASIISLIALIFIGLPQIDRNTLRPFLYDGNMGLVSAVAFVYVAFAGVTKIAAIAEEVKNPDKNLPKAMIMSLAIMTAIYIIISFVLSGNIPFNELSNDIKPIYTLAYKLGGETIASIIGVIGVVTLISLANSGVLASSRFPFAMSRDKLLPTSLSKVHPKYLTPVNTILLTSLIMVLVIIFLDVEKMAKLVSAFKVSMFILVNLSVIILRETSVQWYNPSYKSPFYPYMQIFGILSGVVLLFYLGLMPVLTLLGISILGTIIYFNYGVKASRIGVLKRYGHIPALYLLGRDKESSSLNKIQDKLVNEMINASINKDAGVIIPLLGNETSPSILIELGASLNKKKNIQVVNITEVPDQTSLDAFEKNTPKNNALKRITFKLANVLDKHIEFEPIATHKLTETIQAISDQTSIDWLVLGWNGRAQNGIFFNNPLGWIVSHINSNFGLFKCSGIQKFENLLLAIRPDSPDADKLVSTTSIIANHYKTKFVMLHVVRDDLSKVEIEKIKLNAENKLIGTKGIVRIIVSNEPIDTVSELTAEYDLLILGTPRKDTLRTMLFGTGKDKFAVKATCSVLRLTLK